MKIEHIGMWVKDLELMRDFYAKFFKAEANDLYHNQKTGFKSYFLSFESGARLEIMTREDITSPAGEGEWFGYAHLAFSVGSNEDVDALNNQLNQAGFETINGPRTTGDGYYEAVVLDPEGNRIEITAD